MNYQMKLNQVIDSVHLLAAEAEVQLSSLPDFVHKPNDISTTFEVVYAYVPELVEAGLLSKRVKLHLEQIDSFLDEFVQLARKDGTLWTDDAIRTHPKWQELRVLAITALKELGEIRRQPKLDWVTYVPVDDTKISNRSKMIQFPDSLFTLLKEVLDKRAPDLSRVLVEGSRITLSKDQKRLIQELLGDELCETGLRHDEPNQRGLELEDLIDAFTPYK